MGHLIYLKHLCVPKLSYYSVILRYKGCDTGFRQLKRCGSFPKFTVCVRIHDVGRSKVI